MMTSTRHAMTASVARADDNSALRQAGSTNRIAFSSIGNAMPPPALPGKFRLRISFLQQIGECERSVQRNDGSVSRAALRRLV